MTNSDNKRRGLKKLIGVVLIIAGIVGGAAKISSRERADDAIERGRAVQNAAISFGCILIGILILIWKDKEKGPTVDH